MDNSNFELVFIPAPGFSHFAAEMDLAHRLAAHDPRITVTVFIADIPISDHTLDSYFKSLNADESPRVSIVRLPKPEVQIPDNAEFLLLFSAYMEAYKSVVKDIVRERTSASNGRRLAGFVLDMFCSTMLDVAGEFGLPLYFFFASGSTMLSFMFHFEGPLGGKIPTPLLEIPEFKTPFPETAWPAVMTTPTGAAVFLRNTKQMLKSRGVLLNTCKEIEDISSLSKNNDVLPIYPIGPIVHVDGQDSSTQKEALKTPLFEWLDAQPPQSVVFLCFRTWGAFGEDQVREMAIGLEKSGHRFVWSLRRRPESEKGNDYADFNEVLPEGFLDRTRDVGRVVGWVPQREVLSHASTGTFVSYCGWNSFLECVWLGVPVVGWPTYAGMAMEMSIVYSYNAVEAGMPLDAAEVEATIRRRCTGDQRALYLEAKNAAKNALLDGGSSHRCLSRFIDDVIANVSSA